MLPLGDIDINIPIVNDDTSGREIGILKSYNYKIDLTVPYG